MTAVLFLEVDTQSEWAVASIGPAFIASYLRPHGHRVEMLRIGVDEPTGEVIARVRAKAPDLLALSLTSRQWLRGRELVAAIRAQVDMPVIAGGLHPTFSPEEVLSRPGFDYVCLGEGEAAMLDFVTALAQRGEKGTRRQIEPGELDNIWVRGGPRPRLRAPIEPLDRIAFLARDLLNEPPGVVHMSTQRGCPYPCTYCAARNFDELYRDTAVYGRRRSHENVLAELDELDSQGKLAYVIFLDDTFTLRRRWVETFCDLYGKRFGRPFSLHARVETVDQKLLTRLAGAGCAHITYGVESGSERIRRQVMKRPVTDERIKQTFAWTEDAGIMVTANYMMGLPGETRDDLEATLALAEELDAADFGYFVFYPYLGTHLFDLCRDSGYLPENYLDLPASHRKSILKLPDLSQDDIAEFYGRFTELREELFLKRYPGPDGSEEAVLDQVRSSAAAG
ncbi:MAG: B12-binding domain-containing radical SAM protein [Thermoanaerobaculia bacterium]